MPVERGMATARTAVAQSQNHYPQRYGMPCHPSRLNCIEQAADVLLQLQAPLSVHDKTMTGKSRKAAIHAFCFECVLWQGKEVSRCTDAAFPLYPYRPLPRSSQDMPQSNENGPESTNVEGVG